MRFQLYPWKPWEIKIFPTGTFILVNKQTLFRHLDRPELSDDLQEHIGVTSWANNFVSYISYDSGSFLSMPFYIFTPIINSGLISFRSLAHLS